MTDYTQKLGEALRFHNQGYVQDSSWTEYDKAIYRAAEILHRLLTEGPTQEMLDAAHAEEQSLEFDPQTRRQFNAMLRRAVE